MNKIIAAIAGFLLCPSAFAADPGFYAGLDLGRSTTNTGVTMTNSDGTAFGGLAGIQVNKYVGAEVFYTRAGDFSGQNSAGNLTGNGKANAYGLVAVGTIPLFDAFSLYAKLGVARAKTTDVGTSPSGTIDIGATRTSATYGLGAQYNATPSIAIRLGWDAYGEDRHDFQYSPATGNVLGAIDNFHTNVYSLAGIFRF
jgi:OOP family OmpA-OmpF porin